MKLTVQHLLKTVKFGNAVKQMQHFAMTRKVLSGYFYFKARVSSEKGRLNPPGQLVKIKIDKK